MSKTLLVTAALILLINQFILDRALTDWIYNFVEKYWYWGYLGPGGADLHNWGQALESQFILEK